MYPTPMAILNRNSHYPAISRLAPQIALVFSLCAMALHAQEIVYDNTVHNLDFGLPVTGEVGDEVTLGGTARNITDVQFEYFGNWLTQGNEIGQVRFYLNDGPGVDAFGSQAPKTMIWESPLFQLYPGYNAQSIHDLNITVPNNFTVGMQFYGIDRNAGEEMQLLLYDPPTVGKSFGDYWQKNDSIWGLWETDDVRDNFSLRLKATGDAPDGVIHYEHVLNRLRLTWTGKSYKLQHANILGEHLVWTDVLGAGGNSASVSVDSGSDFFRLATLDEGVLQFQILGSQMQISWGGIGYILQQASSLDDPAGWSLVLSGPNAATVATDTDQKFFRLFKL
ncbi:MAG: hypothetical protein JWM99_878 [Verrucomicrobiales bacterium]|nr:hypothetical protein [Verrucomicrobiales bacterium]